MGEDLQRGDGSAAELEQLFAFFLDLLGQALVLDLELLVVDLLQLLVLRLGLLLFFCGLELLAQRQRLQPPLLLGLEQLLEPGLEVRQLLLRELHAERGGLDGQRCLPQKLEL